MDILGLVDISLWIPLGIVCLSLLYMYGAYPMKTWSRVGVPGPPPLPFIGNMHQLLDKKIGARAHFSKWQQQYGKIYGIQFFRKPCLVVTDLELVNSILVKDFNCYADRFALGGNGFVPRAILDGLVFQSGHDWKRTRQIMTPTFTASKLKMLVGHMNTTARHLANKLLEHADEATQPEGKAIFGAFTLDVIAGTTFGLKLDSQHNKKCEFFKNMNAILNNDVKPALKLAIVTAGMFPFAGHIFKKWNMSIFDQQAVQYFQEVLGKLVAEMKDSRENIEQSDFFKLLSNAEHNRGDIATNKKLTENDFVSQGITFILAGYETTSSTLQYLTHILANNHSVQDRMVEEIRTCVTNPDTNVSYETCQKLKYTEAVIRETLRMYPPLFQLKREVTADTTLNGIPVPRGSGVIIPIYTIGRDPELFEDPDSFNPDRFMDNDSIKPIHFLSFGFGPRQCIGMRLAMVEMKIALVHMLSKVYIEDAQPKDMDLHDYTGLLVPKQPFTLTLKSL